MAQVLGLIAGNGKLPEVLIEEARKVGCRVVLCAITGETSPYVINLADTSRWICLGQLGRLAQFFKGEGVQKTLMAGKIRKINLFRGDVRPDLEMLKVLAKTRNHSDDSLLNGIARYLDGKGMPLLNLTTFLTEEALPPEGVLTKRKPSQKQKRDIDYGWRLAKGIGALDIGQTVVVKNQAILAVEAIEGTDETILRGGALGNGGVTVVKVGKPNQDLRFDVPTVGLVTLDAMVQARAEALAIEAGMTIVLDRQQFVRRANEQRLVVVNLRKNGSAL